jgi:hypothetical protein
MGRSAWLRMWPAWAVPTALIVVNVVWLFGVRGAVIGRGSLLAKQKASLEAEVAGLTAQRNSLQTANSSLEVLQRDLGALRKEQLGSMRERLVSFLVDLAKRVQAAGLSPERISYSALPDKKSGLVHFAATFGVTGSYEQIRQCVNLLEGSPQFIIVERLGLRGDDAAVSLDVAVQLTVATFFADADTGMLRELGIDELPQVAAAASGAAPAGVAGAEVAASAPAADRRTDFSSVDTRVMNNLRAAVAGLSDTSGASPDEDVFVAPNPAAAPRRRSERGTGAGDRGTRSGAFLGQLGSREVSGGR